MLNILQIREVRILNYAQVRTLKWSVVFTGRCSVFNLKTNKRLNIIILLYIKDVYDIRAKFIHIFNHIYALKFKKVNFTKKKKKSNNAQSNEVFFFSFFLIVEYISNP